MIKPKQADVQAAGLGAGLLVLTFLYIGLRVRPELDYVAAAPVFQLTRVFFQRFTRWPGGLLEYAAAFLAQLNYHNWLGAAVFAGLVGLVLWASAALLQRFTGYLWPVAALGPAFLVLMARQRLDAAAFSLGVGLALAVGAALAYTGLPRHWSVVRIATSWVMAGLLFYAAGLWPCALFVVLSGGYELGGGGWITGLGCAGGLLMGLLLRLAWFQEIELDRLLNPWGRGLPLLLAVALHLYLPLATVAIGLLRRLEPVATPGVPPQRKPTPLRGFAPGARRRITPPGWSSFKRAAGLTFCMAGAALVWTGLDQQRHGLRTIAYCAAWDQHERLLAAARRLSSLDPASEIRLHRALFHSGRLLQELFTFTNQRLWTLFPELRYGQEACRAQSQTWLELGQVNLAEHFAHEALEIEGERPDLLRLLACVQVLKGRPEAARVFLHALSRVPFHRGWARTWLRALAADPRLAELPEVRLIRSRMVTTDLPHNEPATASFLRQLLHSNPRNRMAFEYLMAHYLLARQLDSLVQELARLDAFGYTNLPRHIEEAVVLYQHLQGGNPVELHGRQIRPETLQQFQQFAQAVARQTYQTPQGQQALARQFGHTYWHYYFFGQQAALGTSPVRATESS
jgi:hypothetical protein